jgi:hypothetical protein
MAKSPIEFFQYYRNNQNTWDSVENSKFSGFPAWVQSAMEPYFGIKWGSWSLSTRFIPPEILEKISSGTIESENTLNMPDFPGMKLQAILWTEMMVKVVVYGDRAQKL